MDVARLPFEIGKLFGEVDRVLASPTRHLQHETACRQPLTQYLGDRFAIAERRRCRAGGARCRSFVEAALVAHAAVSSRRARRYSSNRVADSRPSAKPIKASVSSNAVLPGWLAAVAPK